MVHPWLWDRVRFSLAHREPQCTALGVCGRESSELRVPHPPKPLSTGHCGPGRCQCVCAPASMDAGSKVRTADPHAAAACGGVVPGPGQPGSRCGPAVVPPLRVCASPSVGWGHDESTCAPGWAPRHIQQSSLRVAARLPPFTLLWPPGSSWSPAWQPCCCRKWAQRPCTRWVWAPPRPRLAIRGGGERAPSWLRMEKGALVWLQVPVGTGIRGGSPLCGLTGRP